MKARVKETGEIVKVTHIGNKCYLYNLNNVELLDEPDYWEKLKHQYAGMAMQGLLLRTCSIEEIAEASYKAATALVTRLKEEEK